MISGCNSTIGDRKSIGIFPNSEGYCTVTLTVDEVVMLVLVESIAVTVKT